MSKGLSAKISVSVVCFLIGLLAGMQLRTQSRVVKSVQAQSSTEQASVINDLLDANAALSKEIQSLEADLERYELAAGKSDLDSIVADLNRLKMINGLVEASGPGIEITVEGEVSETDMQDLVNELRNAGAESMSLGPQRIVGRSVIVKDGSSGFLVDDVRLTRPYVLRAVGNPDTLERAIERKGGLVVLLRYNYPELRIRVERVDKLVLPVYQGKYDLAFAQPAK